MDETCSNVNAECVNSVGSYSCQCKQGYTGDGDNCTGQSNNELDHTLKGQLTQLLSSNIVTRLFQHRYDILKNVNLLFNHYPCCCTKVYNVILAAPKLPFLITLINYTEQIQYLIAYDIVWPTVNVIIAVTTQNDYCLVC